MNDGIDFHIDGEVARLTFNRPDKMNAITHDMWSAIPDVVAAVEGDPGAKVLVVTGAGPHFSAGADIGEFRALRSTAEGAAVYDKAVTAAVQALSSLRKPSVAMVHGNCIGGGCQLAVACDFRFAAADARFGITPAKLGIVYDFLSTRQLVALIGPANARYLLLSAQLVDAEKARQLGLVNEVVEPSRLEEATTEFVRTLCSRSQTAIRGMNEIIERILSGQRESDVEIERIRSDAVHSADYAEGVAAFLERRPPRFD
ncbi:enoyl-CoA hydratase/isomerase family protein [Saccharomonospora viridis]|uniref:Enoyl-CoA hydratase/carnithine racemase n=1 Tax=Saccharomonospora viridis (strain ATCC 15386 / DSM 43017 / JCM 3036 / CCUG 5913 / NBRC 12207 / NCIMB 9602 / P101) TaxID=471857 RepID=C7MR03_SACVD|nr:enoyl-CoA hydratase-related protein [Saccharomonospora viridis]ACU96549.1 enoyl-CoA hydratase/carnithine racemase [Saccharomonospora viridis DSM 43017]